MKRRTPGHTNTSISGDTRADWSEAFEIVSSLEVVYVWHAPIFAREVWNGLERIGFLYPQQIIWDKGRTVLTRNALLVSARTLPLYAEEERAVVRQSGRKCGVRS
jgi:hypothetical protein